MKAPSLTLGIEEEYQIVDPETGELKSFITQILKDGVITVEDIKPELHQSVVEVGSTVCETPAEIREEVVRLRRAVIDLAAKDGLKILAAGTTFLRYSTVFLMAYRNSAASTPPARPDHVLEGLIRGASLGPPIDRPAK